MKKIITCLGILLMVTSGLHAQKYYVRVGGGFALSTHAEYWGEYDWTAQTVNAKRMALGNGVPVTAAFGYGLSKYISIELGVHHFFGFTSKFEDEWGSGNSTDRYQASMLTIIPAVVVSPGLEKVNPYGRFGFLVGVFGRVLEKYEEEGSMEGLTYTQDYIARNYGGLCLGAQGAVGVDFNFNKHLVLFCEAQIDALSYAPKKGKYLEYNYNGEDQLDNMDVRDKEWEYVKEIDMNEVIPSDQPDKELIHSFSLSNYGLMVGLKIKF